MKSINSNRFNVAWFSLADFISRGEKERALSVYKLLMHSVNEQAFSAQLEGDILLACDDEAAFKKYEFAAELYKKTDNFKKAIAVYEHALVLKNNSKLCELLLDLYIYLNDEKNILKTFKSYVNFCIENKKIIKILNKIYLFSGKPFEAQLYKVFVESLFELDPKNSQLNFYYNQTLNLFNHYKDTSGYINFEKTFKHKIRN